MEPLQYLFTSFVFLKGGCAMNLWKTKALENRPNSGAWQDIFALHLGLDN
jgi:hypothetical protein